MTRRGLLRSAALLTVSAAIGAQAAPVAALPPPPAPGRKQSTWDRDPHARACKAFGCQCHE